MSLGFVSSPENQEITILSCCSKKLITLLNVSAAYVLYSCHPPKAAAILACSTYYLLITGQKRVFSTPSRKIQREGNLSNSRRVFHWVLVLSSFLGREGQKRFFCIHCSSKLKYVLSRDQTRTSVDMNRSYYRRNLKISEETEMFELPRSSSSLRIRYKDSISNSVVR